MLRKKRWHFWVAIAVAVVVGLACGPGSDGGGKSGGGDGKPPQPPAEVVPIGPYVCYSRINEAPKFRPIGPDGQIVAAVYSACNQPQYVTKHKVTVHLERMWRDKFTEKMGLTGGGGYAVCIDIPGPQWKPCYRAMNGCISGVWRVRATVDWAGKDTKGNVKEGTYEVKPIPDPVNIKCPGPE